MPTPFRITAMPETEIDITPDGEIQIAQKDDQLGQIIVCFPARFAEQIANEILRLAAVAGEPKSPPFPRPKPFPES